MKYNKISRRMFLQGTGGLLAIPFLESLAPSEARAQASEPIKRYLYYSTTMDFGHQRNWLPKMVTLPNLFDIPGSPQKGSYERLSAIRAAKTQLSPIFGNAFDPFIDKMMMYKGLDVVSHGVHQNGTPYQLGSMWAVGYGSLNPTTPDPNQLNPATETFDRVLAKNAKWDAAKRPALNLRGLWVFEKDALGVVQPKGSIAYTAIDAYNIIFNNGNYPESGQTQVLSTRRDLLTRVMEDYNRVINGKQIGSSDKIILTNALDSVADLQRGLQIQTVNACRHKGQDATPANNRGDTPMEDTIGWANWIRLVTAIFQCDISRVVTLQGGPSDPEDWTSYPTKDYHGNITHKAFEVYNNKPNWQLAGEMYGRHFNKFVAPLLQSMDSCIDSANNKSFLHNGLVHLAGESNEPHRQANVPTVTVGSLNGTLPTGYLVNYSDPNRPFTFGGGVIGGGNWDDDPSKATDQYTDTHSYDYPGIQYQRFLLTLLQSMGLSPSDYEDPTLNQHVMNRTDSLYGAQNNGITNMGGFGICSFEKLDPVELMDVSDSGKWYHHIRRMRRYNWNYYKFPIPLPPKV